ncbi:MAG: alkyl sulfatase dimerization domain-containing protein, partial [Actinomycetes bacterium]
VVRHLWRLYGGWYDWNPSHLQPAPDAALAAELAALAGGAGALANRAAKLAGDGELRLAGHLAEFAALAAPDDPGVLGVRRDVNLARLETERSLMAQGIYRWAVNESADRIAAIEQQDGDD